MIMIVIGVIGISLSTIFVKYSTAPSTVTAAFRLLWTVLLMTPIVLGKKEVRTELRQVNKKTVLLSCLSGVFLAVHFAFMFESLFHTSIASTTTIVATEVIWVSLGFCLFMKGRLPKKAVITIAITFIGSAVIACSDSLSSETHLYGDFLALIAAVAVAIYVLIGRIVRQNSSTTVYTYLVYISCAVSLVAVCIIQGNNLFGFGISAIIVGLLLAVFSTILGHSIFSWCLKFFSPSFVSASKLCEPVVAALLAIPLFGELPSSPLQIVGAALVLGGVYYYSKIEMENVKKVQ